MTDVASIADMRVKDFIAQIGSNAVAPGAGAAGAVTLALAAACAAKASAISLKHRPDDTSLKAAMESFAEFARHALLDADRDAAAFKNFIRSRNAPAVRQLLDAGSDVEQLIDTLLALVDHVAAHIEPTVSGDIDAARSLATAARLIERQNAAESQGNPGHCSR